MAINAHGQRSTVTMSKPAGNGRYVHTGFNTPGRKKVAQIVMSDPRNFQQLAGARQRLFTFAYRTHQVLWRVWRRRQTSEKRLHVRNDGDIPRLGSIVRFARL